MKSKTRSAVVLLTLLSPAIPLAHGADQAAHPDAATTQKTKRTPDQIRVDIGQGNKDLGAIITSEKVFFDKAQRDEAAPKAIPVIKHLLANFDELAAGGDEMDKQRATMAQHQFQQLLAAFGDADAEAQLTKAAASTHKAAAMEAKTALLSAHWVRGSGDPAAQAKVLDAIDVLAKEDPASDAIAGVVLMAANAGAATPELKQRAEKILTGTLTGESAKQMAEQMQAGAKQREMENKPLVLAGVALDGQPFTTASWKGKVILVDFWATWCGPCRAELPRVKKAYADFHAKGLEILGVSCDETADALNKFLKANPDMPWQQLFDAAKPGWHALAKDFGIHGIPTMFLIDKKGVLRSVNAREDFETAIPKLLEEKTE